MVYTLTWYGNTTLLAGTYGRGVWKATVNVSEAIEPTGFWAGVGESGWGLNFNLQGDSLLGAVYSYDTDGSPLWLVLSVGARSGNSYTGPLYRSTGPVFSASPWVWLGGPNATIDTPKKAVEAKKRFMWPGSGPIDGISDGAAFTCEALRLDCRIVMGYPGSNEAAMAVTRGEMDMIYVSDTSANNYVKAGNNKAVANMGRVKSRFFPNLPTIFEALPLDADQQWI